MFKSDITFCKDSGVYIGTKRKDEKEPIQVGCNLKIDLQSMVISRNNLYGVFISSIALQYLRIIGCEISYNQYNNVHLVHLHNYLDRKYGASVRDSEFHGSSQGCGFYTKDSGVLLVNCSVKGNLIGIHVLADQPDTIS